MNLQKLTDNELDHNTVVAAREEKSAMARVLHHLCEVQRRRLFSRRECDSLFSYCVKILGYSEREASYRVNAARAMREFPELEDSINSGTLNLTLVSQAQTFFNQEAKLREKPLSREEKREVFEKIEKQSTREAERILVSLSSAPEKAVKETLKPVSERLTEVRLGLDQETMEHLNRLKEIWSHAMPGASLSQVIKRMAKDCRERHDPMLKAKRSNDRAQKAKRKADESLKTEATHQGQLESPFETPTPMSGTPAQFAATRAASDHTGSAQPKMEQQAEATRPEPKKSESHAAHYPTAATSAQQDTPFYSSPAQTSDTRSRVIPSAIRHAVWMRDQGVCQFLDQQTGQRCGSRHFLELDHAFPFALGGENTLENLRLRCRAHNARHAVQVYGESWRNRGRVSREHFP